MLQDDAYEVQKFSGAQAYQHISPYSASEGASQLQQAGIPGIRYLDQGSRPWAQEAAMHEQTIANLRARGASQAAIDNAQRELDRVRQNITSNYVVFNPALVEILKRYAPPRHGWRWRGGVWRHLSALLQLCPRTEPMRRTSCGVIVTDGKLVLMGHATRSRRWDIPKGVAEPDEMPVEAARRELREETGLEAPEEALTPLGVHRYLPGKDLALFVWRPAAMPDPGILSCTSVFATSGALLPEFDRFGLFAWDDAISRVGRNMARVLAVVRGVCSGDSPAAHQLRVDP